MILYERKIPKSCEIALIGDTHEGNIMVHRRGLERFSEWMKEKNNRYFCHMGDEVEAITSDDNRYEYEKEGEPIPLRQAQAVVEQFRPIRGRGLVWLYGNHPEQLRRFGNLTRDVVCKQLGIPYGTWTCKLRLFTDSGQVCKLFLTHGFRGTLSSNAKDEEQRRANMAAALKRRLSTKASDCLVMAMGHTHKLIVVPPSHRLILSDDGDEIVQGYLGQGDGAAKYIEPDCRWYLNTGSYLRMYSIGTDGYAERAGYDPVELGHPVIRIQGGKVVDVVKCFA